MIRVLLIFISFVLIGCTESKQAHLKKKNVDHYPIIEKGYEKVVGYVYEGIYERNEFIENEPVLINLTGKHEGYLISSVKFYGYHSARIQAEKIVCNNIETHLNKDLSEFYFDIRKGNIEHVTFQSYNPFILKDCLLNKSSLPNLE